MTPSTSTPIPVFEERNRWYDAWRILRKQPLVIAGALIIVIWISLAALAPRITPYNSVEQDLRVRKQGPSSEYWLGTDNLGRDYFRAVVHGGRVTIPAGVAVILISGGIGIFVGAIAGYFAGLLDEALMRITELFMAFPPIILALAISAALTANIQQVGPGVSEALNPNTKIRNAVIAIIVVFWPGYARLMRGLVIQGKQRDYVEAARSIGASHFYILFRTILPNNIAPAIIYMTLDIGNAILVFAGLSFLGLGPDPSKPEWGRMVSTALEYDLFEQWWMWAGPGLAIAILVMAFNFVGDGLRDLSDPRMRR